MANINSIVKVEIRRQTSRVTVRDLETILVLTEHERFTGWRYYTSINDMLEDGFTVDDKAYKAVNLIFAQDVRPSKVLVGSKLTTQTYVEAIVEQQASNSKFLYVITDATLATDKEAIADFVEAQERMMYAYSDSNADVLDPESNNDIFSKLKAKTYDKSFGIYTKQTDVVMPESAYVGRFSSEVIGSTIWLYKELGGLIADEYSTTEEEILKDKNANFYGYLEDEPVVLGNGVVAGGEYIDVLTGCLWLQVRMAEAIWGLIKNSNKISYTNQGIGLIEVQIKQVLSQAVTQKILTDESPIEVSMPNALNVTSAQRNTRILDGVTFSARLDGAIQKVNGIVGTVYA